MTKEANKGREAIGRRRVLKASAAAGAAALLPGIAAAADAPRRGGTLRLAMPYNPASVDPMTGRNLTDFNVLYAVFDALIDFNPATLELRPGLAKSWRFTDPETLALDLVEGVKFHDGAASDAAVVKLNIERYKSDQRSNVKADLTAVEGVEVAAANRAILHLNKPNAGLPTILTNRVGLMVSPNSIRGGGNADRKPVGTGPFRFVDWQDNASFTLVRNEHYWRAGLPYLDGIDMRIISELNTAVRTALTGETDLAIDLATQQRAIAGRFPGVNIIVTPSLVFLGAFLNYARPPLDDVRIRQALNYAVDREQLNQVIASGLGQPTSAVLPKEHWACDPSTIHYYRYDPVKARRLLTEAGHPNGIEIEAWGWPDQISMQRQELILSQLAKSGIHLKLTPVAPQQAMQNFMLEKKGAMLLSPGGGFPDPSQAYEALFGKTALRNAGKIELPGFRPLLDATMAAPDRATRKAAFAKLQRFVIEQALQLPQFIGPGIAVASPKVKNLVYGLLLTPKFQEVWLSA
jgi:ABC-type transport system substrate-binding protein